MLFLPIRGEFSVLALARFAFLFGGRLFSFMMCFMCQSFAAPFCPSVVFGDWLVAVFWPIILAASLPSLLSFLTLRTPLIVLSLAVLHLVLSHILIADKLGLSLPSVTTPALETIGSQLFSRNLQKIQNLRPLPPALLLLWMILLPL